MRNEVGREEQRSHGRYYAEYVRLSRDGTQEVQALLDEKDGKEWDLVGVAGGLPEGGAMLIWDTRRHSFGRGAP